MAETKQQLLDKAKKLGLKVDPATKMADIRQLIKDQDKKAKPDVKDEVKDTERSKTTAKAGKRSSKALKEAEEQATKKTRSEEVKSRPAKPAQKPTRSKFERRAKGYRKVAEKIEKDKLYSLDEAIEISKSTSPIKFDASIELHVNLNVDPRQAEQNIRDSLVLPSGSGKNLKIAALTDDPEAALSAGADIAGGDDLISEIDKGNINFDILIATPALMPKLGKYARVLGPKGLMPNPKSGTVTNDIKKVVSEAKAGRVEYRVDSSGIVHLAVGKVSFETSGLKDNILAIIGSIRSNKPTSIKSNYMKSAYLTTSMGPSVKVDLSSIST